MGRIVALISAVLLLGLAACTGAPYVDPTNPAVGTSSAGSPS